ncbi:unnamed protein product [Prunus armeniaca]|uniref:Uncharacterized protein n=1 Tax=Prunus armeniaca TaxID=36596 RepID=A0A6J5WLU5_PRUAR|nr:unnamed protein product [Prunus armeniaca]CAB4300602.1 unnamed protein product [Prunus armeniaca]
MELLTFTGQLVLIPNQKTNDMFMPVEQAGSVQLCCSRKLTFIKQKFSKTLTKQIAKGIKSRKAVKSAVSHADFQNYDLALIICARFRLQMLDSMLWQTAFI